ncbi:pre-mRNA-splicing factor SPF27 [Culicoides brevitarsis]|uniref:pre-mRNA-splicing factor SPF27 n=1 Tax=Culicoides brevitarsis TaxID=469753 RepID=UPI00307B9CF5
MANEVLVDALPYIDQGYEDPGVREAAMAMVEEECRRYRPTKNYLEYLPALNTGCAFETDLMKNEFERLASRLPLETLNMKRYELPPPTKVGEVSAWNESVENSMAQLEHQNVRRINLDLMLEYGCEAWKSNLDMFAAMQAKAQDRCQTLKKEIQDINWERKDKQLKAGEKLKQLEAHWVHLVSKNYEIEQACAKLENEIQRKRPKRDENTVNEALENADLPVEKAQNDENIAKQKEIM